MFNETSGPHIIFFHSSPEIKMRYRVIFEGEDVSARVCYAERQIEIDATAMQGGMVFNRQSIKYSEFGWVMLTCYMDTGDLVDDGQNLIFRRNPKMVSHGDGSEQHAERELLYGRLEFRETLGGGE